MIWDRRLSASERQLAPNHLKESGIKKTKNKNKNRTQRNATQQLQFLGASWRCENHCWLPIVSLWTIL